MPGNIPFRRRWLYAKLEQPPRNGSPTNRRPRSAAVPASPRSHEEEVEPASVVVQ